VAQTDHGSPDVKTIVI